MNGKQPWLIVAGAALLIHAGFILESHRHLVFQIPVVDAATYHNMASAVARGETVTKDAFWQPPLYPFLLGALYGATHNSVFAARAVQGVSAVLAALFVFALARRMMSVRMATLSAILFAGYGPLLFYYSQLLPTGQAVTLHLLTMLLTLRLVEKSTLGRTVSCGIAFGLAALTVPNTLVCAVIPLAYLLIRASDDEPRAQHLHRCGVFVLAVVICIAPVTIRNASVSGAWVPISTNAGVNLYIGNNEDIDATMTIRPGLDWDRLAAMPFREGARSSVEAQAFFFDKVHAHAIASPAVFLNNLAKKTLYLVQSREMPRNTSIYSFRAASQVLAPLAWKWGSFAFPFGLVGPFALTGLLLAIKGHRDRRLLAAFVLVYAATVILFFPSARYRAPMLPGLLIFAVIGADAMIRQFRDTAPSRWISLAVLAISFTLMNLPIRLPGEDTPHDAELKMYTGVGLQVRGQLEGARSIYDEVITEDPSFADAFYYRGTVNRDLGRRIHAVADFGEAIRLRPDHETALHDLAVIHFEIGMVDTSVALLQRALQVNPIYTRAMRNLGIGLIKQGKHEEGARWLHKAQAQQLPTKY